MKDWPNVLKAIFRNNNILQRHKGIFIEEFGLQPLFLINNYQ